MTTAGVTVNRFCNSGLQAIVQAAHMVLQEGVEAAIGGGVESITMMQRDNVAQPVAAWSTIPALYMVMGETAEVVAKRYGITREAQDEYALVSQQRTARAQQDGFFDGRDRADRRHARRARQEDRREDRRRGGAASIATSATGRTRRSKGCAKLPPVFDTASGQGSVTAGNSSQLSDGASATLVMSADRAQALGIDAAARVSRLRRRRVRARRDGHRPGVRRAEAAEASTGSASTTSTSGS